MRPPMRIVAVALALMAGCAREAPHPPPHAAPSGPSAHEALDRLDTLERAARRIGFSEQMGQMCSHMGAGAPGFTEQALNFHHAADRIGAAARERDRTRVVTELGATLQTCTSCHAAAATARAVTTIPRSAVVQMDGRPTAFVVRGPREYEACPLGLGAADGDDVEVEQGLIPGDEVVTVGAFVLKSELLR